MTSEVARFSAAPVSRYDQQEIIQTIKQTVCKGATDAQLKMFLEVCKGTGLNPFLKEIWFVAEKGMIMAGRDGYLRVANENPNFDGIETRVERDERGVPIKAVCTVWRKDRTHPTIAEAYYNEYKGGSPVWSKYPSAMISKVAEVLALKRSFSINGVVTEEEIGEQGSAAAAQEVAERKIAAGRKAAPQDMQAAREILAEFTQPLAADIVEHAPKETKRERAQPINAKMIDLLQAFGQLKKRFKTVNGEQAYYKILGSYGAEHSDEFPTSDEGLRQARACYKEMSLHLGDMEAMAAKQNEPGPWLFGTWADVESLRGDQLHPDLGLQIVVNGVTFNRADTSQTWTKASK